MVIKDVLNKRHYRPIQDQRPNHIHAAVLIPLFKEDGEHKVLFTQRTNRVETHKGQISFPGGAVDQEDGSLEETALREAYEEIGLKNKDVTVLGRLDDALTVVSSFIVHPFVGHIPYPYDFRINLQEVKRLIKVPLNVFLSGNPKYIKDHAEIEGMTYHGTTYKYGGDVIWGATARIMENLVHIVSEKLDLPGEME